METKRRGIVIIAVILLITLGLLGQNALSQEKKATPAPSPVLAKGGEIKAINRKALCVGINNFKNYPQDALQGCVNDANDMEALLLKWYGFTPGDIVKLTDAQATKANIMRNLKEMVDGAKQGKFNYLVFSLSSHGTQVPDLNGDEPDGLDEAFCPYDIAADGDFWDPKHLIIDDELYDLFIQLPKNVVLEVFLDTCHSGTGIRVGNIQRDRKPRLMPQPSRKAFEIIEGRTREGVIKPVLDKGLATTNHTLWAGCRSDQLSNDAVIAGNWHGAFTYYFCQVMNETQNKLSRQEMIKKVKTAMEIGGFLSQTPQLEENQ